MCLSFLPERKVRMLPQLNLYYDMLSCTCLLNSGLFGLLFYYFSAIEPNFGNRVIVSSLLLGTLSFIFGWRMFTYGQHLYSACKWIGVLAMFNAVTIYVRLIPSVLINGEESLMSLSNGKQFLFVIGILLIIFYGYLIVALAVQIDAKQVKEDMAADN